MPRSRLLMLTVVGAMLATLTIAPPTASAAAPVSFTILHTNDFHGQLEPSGSNPGLARVATVVNGVRTAVGAGNVLLVDGGDEMQGSLLSNLQHGAPTIAAFNALGYDVATFGNHEFDWGQTVLTDRTTQSTFPHVSANIVVNDSGNCATAGWTSPAFATPYSIETVAGLTVGFIGVTTTETPTITVASATAGLCFKDPFESILHYYDTVKASADVIVVLSHLGLEDGGYGYGIPVYGDKSLATKLINAGKDVPLIVGGHSHSNMAAAFVQTVSGKPGQVTIGQAYYNGRAVGRADLTFNPDTGATSVAWTKLAVSTAAAEDAAVKAVITGYATDPTYLALVNTPIGYSAVDLPRNGGTVDNMMGAFVDDAIYNYLNTDGEAANDVDLFLNNSGGIRIDWCYDGSAWVNVGCAPGLHAPALLTYGNMFTILPFGNQTIVGEMTGAQIVDVMNHGPQIAGVIQPAGLKYKYYAYRDANPGPQPFAWGAFDYCIVNKVSHACEPIDLSRTYKVGTNEFLAPAGGDGYLAFKYMKNITYWGDMLNAVDAYVAANHGTPATAYEGPNGDGTLDGRITRDGGDALGSGSILPITILHNNDSHGNLAKTSYVGYTQLATLIKQERLHNPSRTILLDAGDQVQGDAMMYYFKSAPSGFAADGTPLPAGLQTHPMIAVMNALGYAAMTLGNHEFNFGSEVFKGIFAQADFAVLGANVSDSGAYGLDEANGGAGVKPYLELTLGGVKVAIVGITNHRVPNYELPSNITGLSFGDPIAAAQDEVDAVRPANDVVVALTHIGFTENPSSVEIDANVDTNLAAEVGGIDAIIGGHSHTTPVSAFGSYKYLPTLMAGPDNAAVMVSQAYRYNNYLGEVILGVRAKAGGGYEVVSRAGQYISVTMATAEDAATKAIVDPYVAALTAYNNQVVGQTTAPIDTLQAFTQETNGANLQADASVAELASHGITDVDVHLSGAMTNKLMATGATPGSPVTLKISDMFAGMPYENSLVVLSMNGPQLKAVLERAYRNYYYYKFVPGYGGYSYYTTCMLDTSAAGRVYYRDASSTPDGNNVTAFLINGAPVDFGDATTYYNVSTVNYLAAGSCNFNDAGVSLWPLGQIVHDTQYYVRDAVIHYIAAEGVVSPAIEGRLLFGDTVDPVVTIDTPIATSYLHSDTFTLDFGAVDGAGGTTPSVAPPSGVASIVARIDGGPALTSGQVIHLHTLTLGSHTLVVTATDYYGNDASSSVTFSVTATAASLTTSVNHLYAEGQLKNAGIRDALLSKLVAVEAALDVPNVKAARNALNSFIKYVQTQSGKGITPAAAAILIADAQAVLATL